MIHLLRTLVGCLVFFSGAVVQSEAFTVERTNIVLLGATGDLAKKYLWQGIFALYVNNKDSTHSFNILGGSRRDSASEMPKLEAILDTKLNCFASDIKKKNSMTEEMCSNLKADFRKVVVHKQLKSEDHYKEINAALNANLHDDEREVGRLIYLSVPPSAYKGISQMVKDHAMPTSDDAWVRVILEKPFGKDEMDAVSLASEMKKIFKEDQMYRVDHYLGKAGVKAIENFRLANADTLVEKMWNKDYIAKVEVVMKETLDCEGRTSFYNEYGVLRDVHQNHLMQMLALVAMDLPVNPSDFSPDDLQYLKDKVFDNMPVIEQRHFVHGQYKGYKEHVRADNPNITNTDVATFASALAYIDNYRWQGVPFFLTAGKRLDERSSYVRVYFKDNVMRVGGEESKLQASVLTFHVQGGAYGGPAVLLPKDVRWKDAVFPKDFSPLEAELQENFRGGRPHNCDAYTSLLAAAYNGHRDKFVSTISLQRSWHVWNNIVTSPGSKPKIYPFPIGDSLDALLINDGQLVFASDYSNNLMECRHKDPDTVTKGTFRKAPLVTGDRNLLVKVLADDIGHHMTNTFGQRGTFHMAVSGGSSPKALFKELSTRGLWWTNIHIWQVDERCVPQEHEHSNFNHLHKTLLEPIEEYLPKENIHMIPVHLEDYSCNEEEGKDAAAIAYAKEIEEKLPGGQFDMVLLGMGSDGHTASLFPLSKQLEMYKSVTVNSVAPKGMDVPKRSGLGLGALSKAREVLVLVSGTSKQEVLKKISRSSTEDYAYPITMVTNKNTKWYVDEQAYDGIA